MGKIEYLVNLEKMGISSKTRYLDNSRIKNNICLPVMPRRPLNKMIKLNKMDKTGQTWHLRMGVIADDTEVYFEDNLCTVRGASEKVGVYELTRIAQRTDVEATLDDITHDRFKVELRKSIMLNRAIMSEDSKKRISKMEKDHFWGSKPSKVNSDDPRD